MDKHGRGVWIAVAMLAISCGSDGGIFSAAELDVIRMNLGVLPPVPAPDLTNSVGDSAAAATLGQKFFFEKRYSANGLISCATCHDPASGFQDARANTSEGLSFTGRHAPGIINAAYGSGDPADTVWNFWDGRTDSQWAQAIGPPESDIEMGGTRAKVAYLIYDLYRSEYEAVFGPMPIMRDMNGVALFPETGKPGDPVFDQLSPGDQDLITSVYVNFGKSIAAYERKIISRDSRFDGFQMDIASGLSDSDVLTTQEKEGLRLFMGKAGCLECHAGPNFTDWKFHNIAVSQVGANLPPSDAGRQDGIAILLAGEYDCASRWSDHPDKTSCAITNLVALPDDLGRFKTPSLRNLSETSPFMHTGTIDTLEDVIDHYDEGGDDTGFAGQVDGKIAKLNLTNLEKTRLVAFLRTLVGQPVPSELTIAPTLP